MGPRFVQIYGQGESPMTITALSRALVADRSHPRWRERLGSVGIAQSCVEVRIGDEDGRELPAGRGRRNSGPWRARHARLLAQSGSDNQDDPRRLALDGRRWRQWTMMASSR